MRVRTATPPAPRSGRGTATIADRAPRRMLATADGATCAVTPSGLLECWTWSEDDEDVAEWRWLGRGNAELDPRPGVVAGLDGVVSVAMSENGACALRSDGALHCWGERRPGSCTVLSERPLFAPLDMPDRRSIRSVSSGPALTCVVDDRGVVRCWGQDHHARAGPPRGDSVHLPCPTTASGVIDGVGHATDVSVGHVHACAIDLDGATWCWQGGPPSLGVTGLARPTTARRVVGIPRVRRVAAGFDFTCGLGVDDSVWCWREDSTDCDGGSPSRGPNPPQRVRLEPARDLLAQGNHACALLRSNQVWCWTPPSRMASWPPPHSPATDVPAEVDVLRGATEIAVSNLAVCGLLEGATVRCRQRLLPRPPSRDVDGPIRDVDTALDALARTSPFVPLADQTTTVRWIQALDDEQPEDFPAGWVRYEVAYLNDAESGRTRLSYARQAAMLRIPAGLRGFQYDSNWVPVHRPRPPRPYEDIVTYGRGGGTTMLTLLRPRSDYTSVFMPPARESDGDDSNRVWDDLSMTLCPVTRDVDVPLRHAEAAVRATGTLRRGRMDVCSADSHIAITPRIGLCPTRPDRDRPGDNLAFEWPFVALAAAPTVRIELRRAAVSPCHGRLIATFDAALRPGGHYSIIVVPSARRHRAEALVCERNESAGASPCARRRIQWQTH